MSVLFRTEGPAHINNETSTAIVRHQEIAHALRQTGDDKAIRAAERHETIAQSLAEQVKSLNAAAAGDRPAIIREEHSVLGETAVALQAIAVNDPPRPTGSEVYRQPRTARAAVDHAAPLASTAVRVYAEEREFELRAQRTPIASEPFFGPSKTIGTAFKNFFAGLIGLRRDVYTPVTPETIQIERQAIVDKVRTGHMTHVLNVVSSSSASVQREDVAPIVAAEIDRAYQRETALMDEVIARVHHYAVDDPPALGDILVSLVSGTPAAGTITETIEFQDVPDWVRDSQFNR